jgi:hypothetical protein
MTARQLTANMLKQMIELANRSNIEVEIVTLSEDHIVIRFQQPWIIESITLRDSEVIRMRSVISHLRKG